jgi:hypothetical protein
MNKPLHNPIHSHHRKSNMSITIAEMGRASQVGKSGKTMLSAGLTSVSILFFIIGGVLLRISNAEYDDDDEDDDDDGGYGLWAGGVTCFCFAALNFIAAIIAWKITVERQRILARSSQTTSLQAAHELDELPKDGAVTTIHLVSPQTELPVQSSARFVSASGHGRSKTEYQPVQHGIQEEKPRCRQCGRDIDSRYCPSCGTAA